MELLVAPVEHITFDIEVGCSHFYRIHKLSMKISFVPGGP